MHKLICSLLLLLVLTNLNAQHKVTIRVKALPTYHNSSDPVYIAGSFNNWNPGQKEGQLEKSTTGTYSITFVSPSSKYEFKFTRGNWDKVEAGEGGAAINNRLLEVNSDTTIDLTILHWADHFSKKEKKSTASKNVQIIQTNFFIPQLNRTRRIWIYLPEGYEGSKERFPVIYMHDGQNVFEDSSSFSGEWGVDEALDTLGPRLGKSIVVAIDNGSEKRMNEYAPLDMQRFGNGEGDQYINFLVKTLMPYINKNYRTQKSRSNTSIIGSSMGGLISLYAMLKYPKKFGNAGVFSPAFWINPDLSNVVSKRGRKVKGKIYFFAGQQEGVNMVPDMLSIMQQMTKFRKATITTVIRAEGKHNEATWRNEFPLFYQWIMKN